MFRYYRLVGPALHSGCLTLEDHPSMNYIVDPDLPKPHPLPICPMDGRTYQPPLFRTPPPPGTENIFDFGAINGELCEVHQYLFRKSRGFKRRADAIQSHTIQIYTKELSVDWNRRWYGYHFSASSEDGAFRRAYTAVKGDICPFGVIYTVHYKHLYKLGLN